MAQITDSTNAYTDCVYITRSKKWLYHLLSWVYAFMVWFVSVQALMMSAMSPYLIRLTVVSHNWQLDVVPSFEHKRGDRPASTSIRLMSKEIWLETL